MMEEFVNSEQYINLGLTESVGKKESPKLCICGKPCHIDKAYPKKGYTRFCSDECAKKYRHIEKPWYKYLSDYDWLYNQRIVQKKSKETIAKEIGCSHVPVSKWIKIHGIAEVKYNQSQSTHLNDKDWLYNEYKTNHKTCQEIGDEIGVSKSTVAIYLDKHGIEPSPANSYDRHNYVSKEEHDVVDFIKSIYHGEIRTSVRSILNGREVDIYIPEHNLAIEYDGLYSHAYKPWEKSVASIKGSNYHLSKTEECGSHGIQLLHIFADEWGDGWKNLIKSKLHCNHRRIMARKCEIRDVGTHEKNTFLDSYHIQGKDKSRIKIGLYHDNELVSIMTFGTSRFNRNYDWELIRYCVKDGCNVVGGFSKLLSHFRKYHPDKSIISYADRRYSDGGVYVKNGFILIKVNRPNYKYITKDRRHTVNRMSLQKKNLLKQLNRPELTEEQLAYELGYMKIFDCGTLTFVLK